MLIKRKLKQLCENWKPDLNRKTLEAANYSPNDGVDDLKGFFII